LAKKSHNKFIQIIIKYYFTMHENKEEKIVKTERKKRGRRRRKRRKRKRWRGRRRRRRKRKKYDTRKMLDIISLMLK